MGYTYTHYKKNHDLAGGDGWAEVYREQQATLKRKANEKAIAAKKLAAMEQEAAAAALSIKEE